MPEPMATACLPQSSSQSQGLGSQPPEGVLTGRERRQGYTHKDYGKLKMATVAVSVWEN